MSRTPFPIRSLLLASIAALAFASTAEAKRFVDAAGRSVEVPDAPKRVLAAGPPASVLLYVVAPDAMVGWVRAPSDVEKPYLMARVRDLPSTGRLTGRGGTANIEAVLAAKPELIIDVGTVDATYASLADRVQQQTFGRSARCLAERTARPSLRPTRRRWSTA